MRKILVPFDGSDSSLHALEHVLGMARDGLALQVELLNVQTPMPVGSLALSPERIQQLQAEEAGKVLGPARRILEQAGVPYHAQSRVGSPANEIVVHGRQHDCEAIVMGTRGMGPLSAAMVGSVANRVVHLADVPVTTVK